MLKVALPQKNIVLITTMGVSRKQLIKKQQTNTATKNSPTGGGSTNECRLYKRHSKLKIRGVYNPSCVPLKRVSFYTKLQVSSFVAFSSTTSLKGSNKHAS